METTRLSSKGQIIIPKSIREPRNWSPGLEFQIEDSGEGIFLRPVRDFPDTTVDDVLGSTGYRGPRRTLEEMEQAIKKRAKSIS